MKVAAMKVVKVGVGQHEKGWTKLMGLMVLQGLACFCMLYASVEKFTVASEGKALAVSTPRQMTWSCHAMHHHCASACSILLITMEYTCQLRQVAYADGHEHEICRLSSDPHGLAGVQATQNHKICCKMVLYAMETITIWLLRPCSCSIV